MNCSQVCLGGVRVNKCIHALDIKPILCCLYHGVSICFQCILWSPSSLTTGLVTSMSLYGSELTMIEISIILLIFIGNF